MFKLITVVALTAVLGACSAITPEQVASLSACHKAPFDRWSHVYQVNHLSRVGRDGYCLSSEDR